MLYKQGPLCETCNGPVCQYCHSCNGDHEGSRKEAGAITTSNRLTFHSDCAFKYRSK